MAMSAMSQVLETWSTVSAVPQATLASGVALTILLQLSQWTAMARIPTSSAVSLCQENYGVYMCMYVSFSLSVCSFHGVFGL